MKTLGTADTFVPGQLTLPAKYYNSEEIFNLEKERIFGSWMCVGHVSRIPLVGDYFVMDIFDESLIIIRDKNSVIHAYFNVCRHRGSRIYQEDGGKTCHTGSAIQCPYHNWAYYVTDGFLIKPQSMKGVAGFNSSDHKLASAPVHIWEGLIFISLNDKPVPFEKEFAPLIGRFSKWNIGELWPYKPPVTYNVQSNYKYVFENFSECDHCPSIHPELNRRLTFTASQNDLTEGPFLGGYFKINGESMTLSGKKCGDYLGDLGDDVDRAYYYSIMPNVLLGIHPDYVLLDILIPVSPNETIVINDWLFRASSFHRSDFNPKDAIEFWEKTNAQDWEACKWAQQGVKSRAYEPGWYTTRESLLQAFDRHYLKVMKKTSWWLAPPRGFGQFSNPR